MTDKTQTSRVIDKEKFAKFVDKYVYWWGGYRPDPDVDAALRFILAKQPRYVEIPQELRKFRPAAHVCGLNAGTPAREGV